MTTSRVVILQQSLVGTEKTGGERERQVEEGTDDDDDVEGSLFLVAFTRRLGYVGNCSAGTMLERDGEARPRCPERSTGLAGRL